MSALQFRRRTVVVGFELAELVRREDCGLDDGRQRITNVARHLHGGALDTEVAKFLGGDTHGAAQGFDRELAAIAEADQQDALRREFARRVKEEELALGPAKFFGADMTKQVLEGGGTVEVFLLEREQNGGRLLLRESGGSGDGKIHRFVPRGIIAMRAHPSTRGRPLLRAFDSQGFTCVFGKS